MFSRNPLFLLALLCAPWAAEAKPTSLRTIVHSGLAYLRDEQSDGRDGYDSGQWRAQVTSTLPSFIGVGKNSVPFEEPSAFVAASVGNVLAEMDFVSPNYPEIASMVAKTKTGFGPYRWGKVFHFYPPASYNGVPVRAPRYMFLKKRWWGFTNTPPDADTTSVSYLLLGYDRAIANGTRSPRGSVSLPAEAREAYSIFRDVDRNAHYYNGKHGDENTGAFLTWFWDETDDSSPRGYFARPDKGTRIPFNKNDVDCVVNTNVLKTLTAARAQSLPGYREACEYLNDVVARREFYTCGMYYPSNYALPNAVAVAIRTGVSCLNPSAAPLLGFVLAKQRSNGSWQNNWKTGRPDYVQSTAWAVNVILQLGNPRDPSQREAVRRGLAYLIAQEQVNERGQVFWPGEVFYAAIFIARQPVVWRSSAYTTATVLRDFVMAEQYWDFK